MTRNRPLSLTLSMGSLAGMAASSAASGVHMVARMTRAIGAAAARQQIASISQHMVRSFLKACGHCPSWTDRLTQIWQEGIAIVSSLVADVGCSIHRHGLLRRSACGGDGSLWAETQGHAPYDTDLGCGGCMCSRGDYSVFRQVNPRRPKRLRRASTPSTATPSGRTRIWTMAGRSSQKSRPVPLVLARVAEGDQLQPRFAAHKRLPLSEADHAHANVPARYRPLGHIQPLLDWTTEGIPIPSDLP